ncbi:ATP-dependent DNA helicase [Nesterenkonia jeotgali]|uniref:DNA 3'-5' helicase n=1 Tax=Nesterenkonia jeotgali TaxID=317018 RepID=A0A839FWP6_9MICC|nr:ATP-dependent DNA helicase [Nesterenkonia jeotgali]MBA8921494.1 superfamily I DNA/RNA helicase/RecB family exonuclease [Nesterenkonia jeotgali]
MEFDQSQHQLLAAAQRPGHGPILSFGGPGSGKSTLAAELALRHLESGQDSSRLLLLSPTRATSAVLRDQVEAAWALRDTSSRGGSLSEQPSRSFASYAFWLLGEARRREILSFTARRPRLLSGAEQDSIIRELLATDPASGLPPLNWPSSLQEAAGTDGFRKEIRELFDRAAEYGVSPEQLRGLAEQCRRPEWAAAAELYQRYREDLDAGANADAFDPAGLINEACNLLEENPEFLETERQRLRRIIVDDLQEATPSVYRLLRLIGAGADVLAFASPETAVQGFRGARPDKLRSWTVAPRRVTAESVLGLNPETDAEIAGIVRRSIFGAMTPDPHGGLPGAEPSVMVLEGNHRISPTVGRAYARALRRIAPVGPQQPRQRWLQLLSAQPAPEPPQALAESPASAASPQDPPTAHQDSAPQDSAPQDPAPEDNGSCAVEIVPGDYLAEQFVLQEVLDRHHRHGVPFDQIAVIARNGALLKRLVRMFQTQGVPVRQSMSDVILNQEPAVAPLLRALHLVTVPPEPDTEHPVPLTEVLALLTSRYGETDSMTLRSLRQVLRSQERRRLRALADPAEPRSSDELLVAAANNAADPVFEEVRAQARFQHLTRGLERVAAMLAAGHAAAGPSSGPEELLWEIWNAAGVSRHWAGLTRWASAEGRRADHDLDAVMALFQAAERFSDQNPGASAIAFVDHIERLELPMDTLAKTSSADVAIEVLTPASAAGREFDTVILTGLQEGAWPNLNPRGQLLGSGHLVDVVEGRADAAAQSLLVKRMNVLQDEYRLFASAVSRAKNRLYAVAVHAQEESPSMLLDLVVPPGEREARSGAIPRPITAHRLIAELRRHLEISIQTQLDDAGSRLPESSAAAFGALASSGAESSGDQATEIQRQAAARALAVLAEGGLIGAEPGTWWGLPELSTTAPLLEPEEPVRVSPSSVQSAVDSPLQWFTGAAGGVEATDFSRMLGSLIHEIAEHHPAETDREVLTAELDARWDSLGREAGWETEKDRARARVMLKKLAGYFGHVQGQGRAVIARELQVEASLEVPLPPEKPGGAPQTRSVEIRGVIDRVERTDAGELFVIDLKTGRHKPAQIEIPTHGQLGSYQLLVALGAVDRALHEAQNAAPAAEDAQPGGGAAPGQDAPAASPGSGAALLHVGTTVAKTDLQKQDPLTAEDTWPLEQLTQAAHVMSGSVFAAYHSPNQQRCLVGSLCPLCENTKQVTQP